MVSGCRCDPPPSTAPSPWGWGVPGVLQEHGHITALSQKSCSPPRRRLQGAHITSQSPEGVGGWVGASDVQMGCRARDFYCFSNAIPTISRAACEKIELVLISQSIRLVSVNNCVFPYLWKEPKGQIQLLLQIRLRHQDQRDPGWFSSASLGQRALVLPVSTEGQGGMPGGGGWPGRCVHGKGQRDPQEGEKRNPARGERSHRISGTWSNPGLTGKRRLRLK